MKFELMFVSVVLLGFVPSAIGFVILLTENGIKNFAQIKGKCDDFAYTPIHVYFCSVVEFFLAFGTVTIFSLNIFLMPRRNVPLTTFVQKSKAKRDSEIARSLFFAILQNSIGLVVPLAFALVVILIGKSQEPIWAELVEFSWVFVTFNSGNMILIYTWKSKDIRRAVMHHVFPCCKSQGVGGVVAPALIVPYIIV